MLLSDTGLYGVVLVRLAPFCGLVWAFRGLLLAHMLRNPCEYWPKGEWRDRN